MDVTSTKSRTMRLKVWGDNACFTRPEMKVERVYAVGGAGRLGGDSLETGHPLACGAN